MKSLRLQPLLAALAASAIAATPIVSQAAQPVPFAEARQQLLQRADRLAAARKAVDSAALRRQAADGLGGPVVSVGVATYAYNANLNLDLDPINQTLGQAVAALPPSLQGALAGLPSLPQSYALNRSATHTGASLSAVWPLYTGGATDAARQLLDERTQEAKADASQTQEEMETLLVQRYFGAQLAERAAALREAALATIEHHDGAAQRMLDAGVIARVERLQARTALEDARRQARKARDDAELAATALTRTLKSAEPVQPSSPLFVNSRPVEPLSHFVDAALAHHPGLAKIDAKQGQARHLHEAQEALRKPQVMAFGQRQLKTGREADWVAGVSVRWTLFDSVDRQALGDATLREVDQADLMRAQARSDIALLVERRWMALDQARQAYLAMAPGVELADELLRLREAGLKAGTSTPLDLIDAQTQQAKVQTERAQAAYEYVKALADLLESCGQAESFNDYMARADIRVN